MCSMYVLCYVLLYHVIVMSMLCCCYVLVTDIVILNCMQRKHNTPFIAYVKKSTKKLNGPQRLGLGHRLPSTPACLLSKAR